MMPDPTQQLIDELCSLLDETTILSISSDFDLQNPEEFRTAREILLSLSASVEAEEATGFNPSGISGEDVADISSSHHDPSPNSPTTGEGDLKSIDGLTSTTETSHSTSFFSDPSSKASSHGNQDVIHVSVLDGLSTEEKERRLADMFASLKPIDVRLALKKAKGDADLAMDELLNLEWLEQTGERPKGIDGFYVSDGEVAPSKKKKGRKKKKTPKTTTPKSPSPIKSNIAEPLEEPSRDETADDDNIAFISERFALPVADAMEIYQRNKFSRGPAIIAILDNYLALDLNGPISSRLAEDIQVQQKRIPWVPQEYFCPIFETTADYKAAIDVIDALASHFEKPAYLKYDVSYSLMATDAELESGHHQPQTINLKSVKTPHHVPPSTMGLHAHPTSLHEASAQRSQAALSLRHSQSAATSAFKKGRSDPLFRAVGAYHAERSRDLAASHRAAIGAEARYLVDSQSTSDTIDLHGVTVADGVGIAVERAWRWWDGLGVGEERRRRAKEGFKVVTGVGRHSEGGVSRLRVNVFKALVADGWKIEALTGAVLVTGRSK
ncbi:hypothetical protein F5Y18DRAFT_386483 [Xylariaceae sp. FL1019]|nr:hypothetical protein F5Y18DRAFT_386483 [Xylariaceae sp. FL1019]